MYFSNQGKKMKATVEGLDSQGLAKPEWCMRGPWKGKTKTKRLRETIPQEKRIF